MLRAVVISATVSNSAALKEELAQRHEGRRPAAEGVEERHHLRHGGHPDPKREDSADQAADDNAGDDIPEVEDLRVEEGA